MLKGYIDINKSTASLRDFNVSGSSATICAEMLCLIRLITNAITENLDPDEKAAFEELVEFSMSIYKNSDDEGEEE